MIRPTYALPVGLPFITMLEVALIAAFLAMIIEAITPFGIDNITVPLLVTLVVFIILFEMGFVIPVVWQWFVQ
jgi:dolichol kinase